MSKKTLIALLCLGLLLFWIWCIWHHTSDMGHANMPAANANTNANVALAAPSLKVAFENGKYRISGTVPDQATKDKLLARAREVYGDGNFIDDLKIGGVSTPKWLDGALALLPFTKNGVTNGGLSAEGSTITLTGEVPNQEAKDKATKDAKMAAPNATIVNLMTVAGQKALSADQAKTQVKLDEALAGKIVEFESGSDKLTDKGKAVLDELAPMFKDSTGKVEIGGHTDSDGNDAANKSLSQRRAETVKKYLVDKGNDAARFTAMGYGETKPIADNSTPEGKQRNRRIEFQLKGGE